MRKTVFVPVLMGAALTLGACSQGNEEAAGDTAATEEAGADVAAVGADTVLDANAATAEEMASIEGVSEELAAAIVAGQPYADVTALNTALLAAGSADEATAALVQIFVPVNLNDASSEAIALIPGMSDKMIHEFEEYRPYADMAEFDREIGKYVDEDEVARFRRYVTL